MYEGNVSTIKNCIIPIIEDTKLNELNIRFMEKYYQQLLKTSAVIYPIFGGRTNSGKGAGKSTYDNYLKLYRKKMNEDKKQNKI